MADRGVTADPGPEISAGGVVLRKGSAGLEVVLAEQEDRNSRGTNVRLPKGHIDPGETAEEAALREVEEEVGLEARILAPLGQVAYRYFEESLEVEVNKVVHFFLMVRVRGHGHAADGEMARVFWAPIEEAAGRLSFESERDMVERARTLLESSEPPLL